MSAANRIRLALEHTRANFPTQQMDAFTGATPRAPHGRNWDIEVGLFNFEALRTSIGVDFTSLTFELKAAVNEVINVSSSVLISATVSAVDFNTGLTAEQWEADSGAPSYHARFQFTDSQTGALTTAGYTDNELVFGWSITGLTSTGRVTVGSGLLIVVRDGGTGVGAGTAPTPSYTISDQEILAGLESKVNLGENANGASIILRTDTGRGIVLRAVDEGASARLDWYALP